MSVENPTPVEVICSVEACIQPARARGYCHTHYWRWRKHGSTDAPPVARSMELQRAALARVETAEATLAGECWPWPGNRQTGRGYGLVAPSLAVVPSQLAHRNAYAIAYGSLPDEMSVCHVCDNPPCYRPSHLFIGSHADNMADMAVKGRRRGVCCGSTHSRAMFTPDQAAEVVRLHSGGLTYTELGRTFGVHPSTVRRLVLGMTSYRAEIEVES